MLSAEYWLQVHQQRHLELAARSDEARRARAVTTGTALGHPRPMPLTRLRAAIGTVSRPVAARVVRLPAPGRQDPALCC